MKTNHKKIEVDNNNDPNWGTLGTCRQENCDLPVYMRNGQFDGKKCGINYIQVTEVCKDGHEITYEEKVE